MDVLTDLVEVGLLVIVVVHLPGGRKREVPVDPGVRVAGKRVGDSLFTLQPDTLSMSRFCLNRRYDHPCYLFLGVCIRDILLELGGLTDKLTDTIPQKF